MNKDLIIEAIHGSGAILNTIAKRLNVSWHTAKKYCDEYEETRQALQDETEKTIDMAESTLLKSIESGDIQAAKWYLSTKGKKRGYSEKLELEHGGKIAFIKDGTPLDDA
jgi:transposase